MVTYCQDSINLFSLLCGFVLQLVCLAGLQAEGQTLSFSGSLFFAWCFVHEEHQRGNNGQKHKILISFVLCIIVHFMSYLKLDGERHNMSDHG